MEIARTDNLTHEELDQVIDFMIERKRAGQFRAIWEDYGQCVNLLASGEVWLADAWNPVVEDVKKQDVVCKYATPKEGFHRLVPRDRGAEGHPEPRGGARLHQLLSRGMVGLAGRARRGTTPRRRPATSTCRRRRDTSPDYTDYEWWYQGGSSPEPKEGWPLTGRDTGAYDTRWGNIMHWMTWPDDPDYYATRWNDFLSA